jgi:selenocysteine lyase/cysteine desulfurase
VRPEFVALSFYKMFGYPTGIGALIARRDALAGSSARGSPAGPWSSCRPSIGCTC